MQLPMLSHSSFRSAVKKWLKSQVVSRRDFSILFHLPPCDVVPAAHLSLGKMLINHHGKMAEFDWNVPPSCNCQEFIQEHPDLEVVTQYILETSAFRHYRRFSELACVSPRG